MNELRKPQNPSFESFFHNKQVEKDLNNLPVDVENKFWDQYLPLIEKYPFNEPLGIGEKKHGTIKGIFKLWI